MSRAGLVKLRRTLKGSRWQYLHVDAKTGEETWVDDWIDGTALTREEAEPRRAHWREIAADSPFIIYHALVPC